jgi:outer membrane protein TolC
MVGAHCSRWALGLLLGAITGCAVGPSYHTPKVVLPDTYAGAGTPAAPPPTGAPGGVVPSVDLAQWWHALNDPELDSLIERAVKGNPDVLIALDRLQAARSYEAAVVGTVLPLAEGSAGAARGTGSDLTRGRAAQTLVSADNDAGWQHINAIGGFDAIWQLDVFGKYRREIQAVRFDTQASLAARNAVLVAVIADVARAYVDLRGLQVRAAVLAEAVVALRESLRIVRIRYERGITNELDVTLATRELATVEAQAVPVAAQAQAAQYTSRPCSGSFPRT